VGLIAGRLVNTKDAARFLLTTERMIRRGREAGELQPCAMSVHPRGWLYDIHELAEQWDEWMKRRHVA
jgi:hypothetical protein